jgi:DsbC/DsbD-like thiol-disulfide interchange protein
MAVIALAEATPASAPSDVITELKTYVSRDFVHAGEMFKTAVQLTIGREWHINANPASDELLIPTSLEFEGDAGPFHILDIIYPEPQMARLGFSESDVAVYSESALIGALFRIDAALKTGTYKLKGTVAWQACNDVSCLPPESRAFEIVIVVVEPGQETHDAHTGLFQGIVFYLSPKRR